jgi:hypothetical protein
VMVAAPVAMAMGWSLVLAVPQCRVRESMTATSPFLSRDRR